MNLKRNSKLDGLSCDVHDGICEGDFDLNLGRRSSRGWFKNPSRVFFLLGLFGVHDMNPVILGCPYHCRRGGKDRREFERHYSAIVPSAYAPLFSHGFSFHYLGGEGAPEEEGSFY
jgi:hypothetical protein